MLLTCLRGFTYEGCFVVRPFACFSQRRHSLLLVTRVVGHILFLHSLTSPSRDFQIARPYPLFYEQSAVELAALASLDVDWGMRRGDCNPFIVAGVFFYSASSYMGFIICANEHLWRFIQKATQQHIRFRPCLFRFLWGTACILVLTFVGDITAHVLLVAMWRGQVPLSNVTV